jgi:hypothetical protein
VNFHETAESLRRIADAMDKSVMELGRDADTGIQRPHLSVEEAFGAAGLLCYIRDLITGGGKDVYRREDILVLLETISRDPSIFPCGLGVMVWVMEDDSGEGE